MPNIKSLASKRTQIIRQHCCCHSGSYKNQITFCIKTFYGSQDFVIFGKCICRWDENSSKRRNIVK